MAGRRSAHRARRPERRNHLAPQWCDRWRGTAQQDPRKHGELLHAVTDWYSTTLPKKTSLPSPLAFYRRRDAERTHAPNLCRSLPLLAQARLHQLRRADRPDRHHARRSWWKRRKWISEDAVPARAELSACCCPVPRRSNSRLTSAGCCTAPGAASWPVRSSSCRRRSSSWELSFVYVSIGGNVPWVAAVFYGLKPAVLAIVAAAVMRIGDGR